MNVSHPAGEATRPLLVEWPSSDRAELEALAARGLVAVHYVGSAMELLPNCKVSGHYLYAPLTRRHDRVTIRDASQLYAAIPIGAAKLEGALRRTGQLNVEMTVVGRYEASETGTLQGQCTTATHVVTALTVGAFDFFAGASASVEAAANGGTGAAQAGGGSSAKRETLNRDGDEAACAKTTASDKTPPYGCGAALRVDLEALASSSSPPRPVDARPGETMTPQSAAPSGAPPGASSGAAASPPGPPPAAGAMVHIPAATVRVGATDLHPTQSTPSAAGSFAVQALAMQPFDIDVTEVTGTAYARCIDAGFCTPVPGGYAPPNGPVDGVLTAQATAYCAFVQKRLPTDEEWEYAARGTDFRKYPWGNDARKESYPCKNRICPVGSDPRDRSPFGVLDMGRSVGEWTTTVTGELEFEKKPGFIIRGGSYLRTDEDSIRTAYRLFSKGRETYDDRAIGFRCARSAPGALPSPRAEPAAAVSGI